MTNEDITKLISEIKVDLRLDVDDVTHDDYFKLKISDALIDLKKFISPSTLDISHVPDDIVLSAIRKLVIMYFNRNGLEGTGYFSEGGLTFSYKEKNEALVELNRFRQPTLTNIRGDSSEG